jgi:hypothetical protein
VEEKAVSKKKGGVPLEEMKPCCRCGSQPVLGFFGQDAFKVNCPQCYVVELATHTEPIDAIKYWNSRHDSVRYGALSARDLLAEVLKVGGESVHQNIAEAHRILTEALEHKIEEPDRPAMFGGECQ